MKIGLQKAIAHPWQCDAMGHMTTRFYVGIFDDSIYHFVHDVFGYKSGNEPWIKDGWADIKHVVEYLAEVKAGDLLEVEGELRRIGCKSFNADLTMNNISTGTVAATLNLTAVLFDLQTRRAAEFSNIFDDAQLTNIRASRVATDQT